VTWLAEQSCTFETKKGGGSHLVVRLGDKNLDYASPASLHPATPATPAIGQRSLSLCFCPTYRESKPAFKDTGLPLDKWPSACP